MTSNLSFRSMVGVLAIPLPCACSSLANGLEVSELLATPGALVDRRCRVDGIVAFDDGFRIVDSFDKDKALPLAIPVVLFDEVKSLVGKEVIVDGALKDHHWAQGANGFDFYPTSLLISSIGLKSGSRRTPPSDAVQRREGPWPACNDLASLDNRRQ